MPLGAEGYYSQRTTEPEREGKKNRYYLLELIFIGFYIYLSCLEIFITLNELTFANFHLSRQHPLTSLKPLLMNLDALGNEYLPTQPITSASYRLVRFNRTRPSKLVNLVFTFHFAQQRRGSVRGAKVMGNQLNL